MRKTVVMVTSLLVLVVTWRGLVEGAARSCNLAMFSTTVNEVCIPNFHHAMAASGYQESCPWPAVKGTYNTLRECIVNQANYTWCNGWRYVAEGIYMDVHDKYFSECGAPAPLQDPPLTIMVLLASPGVVFTLFLPLLCLPLTTFNKEMPGTLGL